MKAITYNEVYVVKLGRWALHARLSNSEQNQAIEVARAYEADTGRATQVIEETLEPEAERLTIRIVAQHGHAEPDTKGPDMGTDMGSRIFMVLLNSFGIAAIVTVIMAITLASLRDGASGNSFNVLLMFSFAATFLTAGLLLVKIYIPVEWILWRNKSAESQQRTIEALLYGKSDAARESEHDDAYETEPDIAAMPPGGADEEDVPPPPPDLAGDAPAPTETVTIPAMAQEVTAQPDAQLAARETMADQGEQTSFQIGPAAPAPAPAESLIESAAAIMDSLLEKERAQMTAFADAALAHLTAARPQLQAFERGGLNLYLAGAATALSERGAFPENVRLDLLRKALTHTGTHPSIAEAFVQRLDVSAQRPRFKHLIDAGHAAMTAQSDGNTAATLPALADLIKQWADPNVRGAEIKKVTFLLTDIVGSTALTSKIGNSGAQRVVRAHNAAARAACKNFRGTEVKHTGDGMLLTFPDAAAAGRAAMEIQAEGSAYARDNPEAPLVMRIGIHTGEASFEEGEYYGPALSFLNGVCSAAGDNQIFCSDEAKSRCVGPAFRFQDMGKRILKGSDVSAQVHKLDWTPKTKTIKGPLEYGQIGGKAPA